METSSCGLFITWTVYGAFLPGDERGWRHRQHGQQFVQPRLEAWHRDRLSHDVLTLTEPMRKVVEDAMREIRQVRSWTLWAVAARSNQVHVVVTAPRYKPTLVWDQLKAKGTRDLRESFEVWKERPVWSAKGDIEYLDDNFGVEQSVRYVLEAQDRMERDR